MIRIYVTDETSSEHNYLLWMLLKRVQILVISAPKKFEATSIFHIFRRAVTIDYVVYMVACSVKVCVLGFNFEIQLGGGL